MRSTSEPGAPRWLEALGARLLGVLAVAALIIIGLAVSAQPRMGDEWDLAWRREAASSLLEFTAQMYREWTGRVFPSLLAGIALSSDGASALFRLLTVPLLLMLLTCAYYLATGNRPPYGRRTAADFVVFGAVLWLGLPVVGETAVWQTGAIYYLWPGTAGLALLCLFRHARDRWLQSRFQSRGVLARLGWFLAAFVVGTANEQMAVAVVAVLSGWGWLLRRECAGALRLPAEVWCGLAGLAAGIVVFLAAPGNFARLAVMSEGGGTMAHVVQAFLYLGGAYFALGSGDCGRSLWLGLGIIVLCASAVSRSWGVRPDAFVWVGASIATFLPILPLAHAAAPRTTFFAALFLVMAARSATGHPEHEHSSTGKLTLAAIVLTTLVVIDGIVGWAANRMLAEEMQRRLALMQAAVAAGNAHVVVPYLSIIPSRLTYLLHAKHDAEFLDKLARQYGLQDLRHDDSPGAPRPFTVIPLKELRNALR